MISKVKLKRFLKTQSVTYEMTTRMMGIDVVFHRARVVF